MLKFLRNSVSSWIGVLILGLAVGAMVLTLFQRQGQGGGTIGTGPVLASVGNLKICLLYTSRCV